MIYEELTKWMNSLAAKLTKELNDREEDGVEVKLTLKKVAGKTTYQAAINPLIPVPQAKYRATASEMNAALRAASNHDWSHEKSAVWYCMYLLERGVMPKNIDAYTLASRLSKEKKAAIVAELRQELGKELNP